MSSQITAPTAVMASDAVIEVQVNDPAGNLAWCEINGADSTDVTNGEVSINEVPTYRGTVTQTGELSKPDIVIGLSSYLPYMPVMREILGKYGRKEPLRVRWYNPEREFIPLSSGSNNTVSISTAGVVSFGSGVTAADLTAFATDQVPEGEFLFTGTSPNVKDYLILNKTVSPTTGQVTAMTVVDAATFAYPSAAVTDAAFGFRQARNEMPPVSCDIMNAGNMSGAVNQVGYASQVSLKAKHTLPLMVINSNPA